MAPLCGPHHGASPQRPPLVDYRFKHSPHRWCKRPNLWPKNTSSYHRPPLNARSDVLDEHFYRSEVDNSDTNSDNTTVVIGSVVGVIVLIAALGIVVCCCMASRKAKRCRRKKKKKDHCCGEKKGKDKKDKAKKDKDKKPKKDKDKPYVGKPIGTWQEVQDWNTYHSAHGSPGLHTPDPAYYRNGGVGWQMGLGNAMDAPQNNYGY